jgi:hypothetical protein
MTSAKALERMAKGPAKHATAPASSRIANTAFTKEIYSMPDMVLSVILFMCASAGMSIANKMAVTVLPVECTLVLIQMAFTVLFLLPKFFMPATVASDGSVVKAIELGGMQDALMFAPCPIFLFAGMLLSSMFAYSQNTM